MTFKYYETETIDCYFCLEVQPTVVDDMGSTRSPSARAPSQGTIQAKVRSGALKPRLSCFPLPSHR